jgi:glutamine synthetase
VKTTPHALDFFLTKKAKEVFEKHNIFSERELEARVEIMHEKYIKKIQIEGRVIGDLALNHIVPTAIKYQNKLITNVRGLKELGLEKEGKTVIDAIKDISKYVTTIQTEVDEMTEARKKANNIDHAKERSIAYCDDVKEHFEKIRYAVDKLELLVDDEDWPLVKYREMLFIR